eukprot:g33316.t1
MLDAAGLELAFLSCCWTIVTQRGNLTAHFVDRDLEGLVDREVESRVVLSLGTSPDTAGQDTTPHQLNAVSQVKWCRKIVNDLLQYPRALVAPRHQPQRILQRPEKITSTFPEEVTDLKRGVSVDRLVVVVQRNK